MYQLKQYLKAINQSKEKLMDTEDEVCEKKYPVKKSFILVDSDMISSNSE